MIGWWGDLPMKKVDPPEMLDGTLYLEPLRLTKTTGITIQPEPYVEMYMGLNQDLSLTKFSSSQLITCTVNKTTAIIRY